MPEDNDTTRLGYTNDEANLLGRLMGEVDIEQDKQDYVLKGFVGAYNRSTKGKAWKVIESNGLKALGGLVTAGGIGLTVWLTGIADKVFK